MAPKRERNETFTITFGECVENHHGNQRTAVSNLQESIPITKKELEDIEKQMSEEGMTTELVDLSKLLPNEHKNEGKKVCEAALLIIRRYKSGDEMSAVLKELNALQWDKKTKMYGRVVNKHARWNLCFADKEQEPDYEQGKGRIYDIQSMDEMSKLQSEVKKMTGRALYAEGNHYYDSSKCYIGFHGDTERSIVIALRVGAPFDLHYRWYKEGKPISDTYTVTLENGDMYIMSEAAVGQNWKKRQEPTLRHAAGNLKVIEKTSAARK